VRKTLGIVQALLAAALATFTMTSTAAEAYPTKPVRLVVAFPAGGGLDATARAYAQKLSQYWGQSVIVENRPGASGMIGAEAVARSVNDGYTLLVVSPAEIALNEAMYTKMSYSPRNDFEPVGMLAAFPMILTVGSSVPATSMQELISLSQKSPGGLPYASAGHGSMQQLVGEWLTRHTDLKLRHVPYRGTAQAIPDVVSGVTPMAIMGLAPVSGLLSNGQLRGIAVTSPARSTTLPNVPTLKELGLPFDALIWFGIAAPKGVPSGVIEKISAGIQRASSDPEIKQKITSLGGTAASTTPGEFAAFVQAERVRYFELIKDAGIKLE
jgi:tripartite-type tricarboxylate transporter receptor subunit TctC